MMRRFANIMVLGVLLFCGAQLMAQPSKTLPTEPAEFIAELTARVSKFAEKDVEQYVKGFEERWLLGSFTAQEQDRFIGQTNIMLLKNFQDNELLNYIRTFDAIKNPEAFGKIDPEQFFMAADSCILLLTRQQTGKYFKFISTFAASGAAFQTSNASWKFSQPNPQLSFGTFTDEELGKTASFPYMTFEGTNLIYRGAKDSTKIYNTSGQLNLMNKMFNAQRGTIDWAKMDLDPNDVYVDLLDYGLNLNYSFVRLDTVIFHYNSLLGGQALKGKFEDINKGYANINKANFPYFRSYEGGVVIENLIPGVRYEGGFSLRGVRKIGSAYWEWVEIEETDMTPEETDDVGGGEEENPDFEDYYEDLGYEYDDNAFYFTDEDEVVDDSWEEEETDSEFEEDLAGSDFAEVDPMVMEEMSTKERKLMKATLTVFHKERKTMSLRALEFVLDLEKLVSRRTEVALYISDEDSITHPSVDVVYEVEKSEVTLFKDMKDKKAHQAFLSPYHNYYLYFDAIRWNMGTDKIAFTSIIDKANQTSAIESYDFFKLQRFRQTKGILRFNPVGAIYRFSKLYPGQIITAEAICEEYNAMDQLPALLLALPEVEGTGYIQYNKEFHIIKPLPKTETWAKAARGTKDYDAIQIITAVKSGNNAELDLNTRKIDMFGVDFFTLSDSQYVATIPNQQRVRVLENRDLNYDGVMAAGKLNFYGRMTKNDSARVDTTEGKFTFQYDNYKILCDSLDSLTFVLLRDPPVGYNYTKLQKALRNTTIEGVTGAIYINRPNNKNGLEPSAEYPVFDSYTKSYVYWAKPNVRGGVYTKDKLFFAIDPFVLDSLEDFDELSLSFEGEFKSSEILPPIRQQLSVMEDYTLGFKQITPADTGYSLYEGKGRVRDGNVTLDGSGLSTSGAIDFMNTTAESDSFQMYFDSVKAVTNAFNLPKQSENGVSMPDIRAKTVAYKWLTKKDQIELETTQKGEPIELFEGEGLFVGKLIVTKDGLKGSGKLTLGNVTVESEDLLFTEQDFIAKKGTFRVFDKNNPGKELFVATDAEINYDVAKHHSEFACDNIGQATSSFPDQQFKTSLGKGVYDKASNDLQLESRSIKANDNYFYSSDPKQDSLAFKAKTAYYNFDEKEIKIEGVPYIYVADAKITPAAEKVTVKKEGLLQKLEDAVIDANLETKYHTIYDAKVDITSAKNYLASGKYNYDTIGGKPQYISMPEISVQRDTLTIAKGNIPEEQGFYLTDRIFFKGATYLKADRKYLRFDGEVKIESENEFFADSWFKFDTIVNPDSVFIPISEKALGKLVAGLHYVKANRAYYSTFLQPVRDPADIRVAEASGGLTFDRITDEFRIGPAKKLTGVEYRGTTSSLDDQNNVITTVGKLDIPFNWNKNTIEVEAAGKFRDDIGSQEISTELMLRLNFSCISKEAWQKAAELIKIATANGDDINWTDPLFVQSISEFLDPNFKQEDKNTQLFMKEVEKAEVPSADIKVAKDLGGSLLLSNVRLRYDGEYKSFYYVGDMGLIGVNGTPVNKMLGTNSRIEYNVGRYTPAGIRLSDTLRVYLEEDEFTWYYFTFYGDVVYTTSSDAQGYNAQLTSEIEKRKKDDGFRFEIATDIDKDEFLTRFLIRYSAWRDD